MKNDLNELMVVLESHFPILAVESHEEARFMRVLERAAKRPIYSWSINNGLQPVSTNMAGPALTTIMPTDTVDFSHKMPSSKEPEDCLPHISKHLKNAVVVLKDIHPWFTNAVVVRGIKDIALGYRERNTLQILLSHKLQVPSEIERDTMHFDLALPGKEEIMQMIRDEAKVYTLKTKKRIKSDNDALDKILQNLQGLTVTDADRLIRTAIYDDGVLDADDIDEIQQAKFHLLGKESPLGFEFDHEALKNVGGFNNVKRWLKARKELFLTADEKTMDVPKAVLLFGVQGGGKSLCAKAVAGEWGVPLLSLDMGAVYSKWQGTSEETMREALKTADAMSPCVLWVDEIEKGLAQDEGGLGTSKRLLKTLLTWMQERRKPVFIVATANDVSALPPELIRKGRVDEIFFCDLPPTDVRKEIYDIHLGKRDMDSSQFDLDLLATKSEGFTGSGIEQTVVSARLVALQEKRTAKTDDILAELGRTKPLSVFMAEKIQYLQRWAKDRSVPAHSED